MADRRCEQCGYIFPPMDDGPCPRCRTMADRRCEQCGYIFPPMDDGPCPRCSTSAGAGAAAQGSVAPSGAHETSSLPTPHPAVRWAWLRWAKDHKEELLGGVGLGLITAFAFAAVGGLLYALTLGKMHAVGYTHRPGNDVPIGTVWSYEDLPGQRAAFVVSAAIGMFCGFYYGFTGTYFNFDKWLRGLWRSPGRKNP